MNNLTKWMLVIVLIGVCLWEVYPPQKKLKMGIDLAGGTSLLYQIDDSGLESYEKQGLAQRMISILRERIDPDNKMNMVWRAVGTDRIEIQLPLATKESRAYREIYQQKLDELTAGNLVRTNVQKALGKAEGLDDAAYKAGRDAMFAQLAGENTERLSILNAIATAHDAHQAELGKLENTLNNIADLETQITDAGININSANSVYNDWETFSDEDKVKKMESFSADTEEKQALIENLFAQRKELTGIRQSITQANGTKDQLTQAWNNFDSKNINKDLLIIELNATKSTRDKAIAKLKSDHPNLSTKIDELVVAFDNFDKISGSLDDPQELIEKLRGSGVLEFRILPRQGGPEITPTEVSRYMDRLQKYGDNPKKSGDSRYAWYEINNPKDFPDGDGLIRSSLADKTYILASNQSGETLLHDKTGASWKLTKATPTADSYNRPAVSFTLNESGGIRFFELTKQNKDRPLCILLDNKAYSAPNINEAIYSSGIISGIFTPAEVNKLVDTLNAGSLPARLGDAPISTHTVKATIGSGNLSKGVKAGLAGLAIVIVVMMFYYMVPGFLASIALLVNLIFILGVMAISESTFTLPGIAGLILTIGMAVDANVLISERIREEQKRGSSVRLAVSRGYDRAFKTILDANITTFIVALILWLQATAEVKGFAITLMIGIVSSMFSAIFITRLVFELLLQKNVVKKEIKMFQLINPTKINWIGMKTAFRAISITIVIIMLGVFFGSSHNKYSIEFTGGTGIQVVLNEQNQDLDRQAILDAIRAEGEKIGNVQIANALVQEIESDNKKQFEIVTTETNRVETQLTLASDDIKNVEKVEAALLAEASKDNRLQIKPAYLKVTKGASAGEFTIITNQVNTSRLNNALATAFPNSNASSKIINTVNDAVLSALSGKLDQQENLQASNLQHVAITPDIIAERTYLQPYLGGLMISCEFGNNMQDSLGKLKTRFDQFRFTSKSEDAQYANHPFEIFAPYNSTQNNSDTIKGIEVAILPDDITADSSDKAAWENLINTEKARIADTLSWTTSLPRITQIDPSIGNESLMKALVAIVLSLIAIVIYIWIRFGTARFSVAAVIALVHDVSIALGLVAATAWLSNTGIGQLLKIGDFKIDLPMIAAFLTVIGYSLNDTIVVFDRIRENRGKQTELSDETVNRSINQTLSRTIMTSLTTLIVLITMYLYGGEGLRGFNYVLIIGVLVGTYSSVGVAAPIVAGAKTERGINREKAVNASMSQTPVKAS